MGYKEILSIVEDINAELYSILGEDTEYANDIFLTLFTDGSEITITILDLILWSSVIDDRKYDEATDTHEPLEPFIRHKLKEVCTIFSRILLNMNYPNN